MLQPDPIQLAPAPPTQLQSLALSYRLLHQGIPIGYPVHLLTAIFDDPVAGERMPSLAPGRKVYRRDGEFHPGL